MNACFASFNTKGFSSALNSYQPSYLPPQTHLTYEGCFNELKYPIGPKATKSMELYLGYARAQNPNSAFDNGINNFLAIFTKGCKDGADRDGRVLNAVIVLDVSGSMGSGLTSKGEGHRLELAKSAIMMFVSKLRAGDSFGLVTFNNSARTVIPCNKVGNQVQFDKISQAVKDIHTGGGTTLLTGFQEALNQIKEYLKSQQNSVKNNCQNRLIILTDVQDNSVSNSKHFVQQIQKTNIHTTIIGISDSFRSQVCQQLSEVKGFNYFCATQLGDLQKYLFQNFSYTFFPSNFDIQIIINNNNVKSIEVFGTNDSSKVPLYNVNSTTNFLVTKTKTSFPSQLQLDTKGNVKTYGGLILVKLNLKNKDSAIFQGNVLLKYRSPQNQQQQQNYHFKYQTPVKEQYYSDESLHEALSGFLYVYEVKNILKAIKEQGDKPQIRKKYVKPLKQLKNLVPKSKQDQLQKLIQKLKQNNKQVPAYDEF